MKQYVRSCDHRMCASSRGSGQKSERTKRRRAQHHSEYNRVHDQNLSARANLSEDTHSTSAQDFFKTRLIVSTLCRFLPPFNCARAAVFTCPKPGRAVQNPQCLDHPSFQAGRHLQWQRVTSTDCLLGKGIGSSCMEGM